MASINTNTNYYPLFNTTTGGSSNKNTGLTSNALPAASLSQALGTASVSGSSSSGAYLLDLSPQAQQYMNASSNGAVSGVIESTGAADSSAGFVLTAHQRQTISDILTKYKDAPYTQDTFNQIQNDLAAAGLDSNQMARKDQAKNFNPTLLLLDDLNGNFSDAEAMTNVNEQPKANNYMQQIISQWKTLSSTASQTKTGAVATNM